MDFFYFTFFDFYFYLLFSFTLVYIVRHISMQTNYTENMTNIIHIKPLYRSKLDLLVEMHCICEGNQVYIVITLYLI